MVVAKKRTKKKVEKLPPSAVPISRPQPFEVRKSKIHGRGVFATRKIHAGERIAEYVGEKITPRESDRRYPDDPDKPHHTFLFTVDDKTVVDANFGGNSSRWINHSCDPNCESVIENGRIYIDAIKDIRKGQEIYYDYCLTLGDRHTPAAKKRHTCLCGSAKCRGTLLVPKRR